MTVTNQQSSQGLSWRRTSPLHSTLGARVYRVPLVMSAGVKLPIFNSQYAPNTIDRIIGVYISLGQVTGGGTISIVEMIGGFQWGVTAANQFGNYWFNLETPLDAANIELTSSVGLTASSNALISLYNFEIAPVSMGHT